MADVEETVRQLNRNGFPVNQISVVAKNFISDEINQNIVKTDDLKNWFSKYFGWLIPAKHFSKYNEHFHAGKYLLVAYGTKDEQSAGAWGIVRETRHVEANLHEKFETEN